MTKQEREDAFIAELKTLSQKYGVTVEPYMALRATALSETTATPSAEPEATESAAQKVEQALMSEPTPETT